MLTEDEYQRLAEEFYALPMSRETLQRRAEIAAALLYPVGLVIADLVETDAPVSVRLDFVMFCTNLAAAAAEWGENCPDQVSGMQFLDLARQGYDNALQGIDPGAMPLDWNRTQLKRAQVLFRLGEAKGGEDGIIFLQQTADNCRDALAQFGKATTPRDWALAHLLRANALVRLAEAQGGDSGLARLNEAVGHYDAALSVIDKDAAAVRWAATHMNRATALQRAGEFRSGAEGVNLLRRAVDGFDAALTVRTRTEMPTEWAIAMMNRSNALCSLAGLVGLSEQMKTLRSAIDGYDQARQVLDKDVVPDIWARVEINRAKALMDMGLLQTHSGGDGVAELKQAIAAYDAALTVVSREASLTAWAKAQMMRYNALSLLAETGGIPDASALRQAIAGYDQILDAVVGKAEPADWARVQMNRANSYLKLGDVVGGAEGIAALHEAIAGYDLALSVRGQDDTTADWALVEMNRASACVKLHEVATDEADPDILCKAVHTLGWLMSLPEGAPNLDRPLFIRRVAVSGHLLLENWDEVVSITRPTFERAAEWLLGCVSSADLAHVIGGLTGLGDMAAFALARQGKAAEAILMAEAGRSHRLREHLRLSEKLNCYDIVEVKRRRSDLDNARQALRRQLAAPYNIDVLDGLEERLRTVHAAYMELLGRSGLDAPSLPDFGTLATASTNASGTIVVIVVTTTGTIALIAPRSITEPTQVTTTFIPSFRLEDMLGLLRTQDGTGWLAGYFAFSRDVARTGNHGSAAGVAAWNRCITDTLKHLWRDLMEPVHRALSQLGLPCGSEVTLLVPGQLSVLPLHAAGYPDENGRWTCLFDRWTIAFAPSLAVLARPREALPANGCHLLAVTDPTRDLDYPTNPAEAAAPWSKVHRAPGLSATRSRVTSMLAQCHYASFLCHGLWDPFDPDRSGLQLADGMLTVADLRAAGMERCRLAVLAACQSGLTSLRWTPDEMQGLPSALLNAGVGAVAATFWPIYNHTAASIVGEVFSAHCRDGLSPSAAVRRSQQRLRDGALTALPNTHALPKASVWSAAGTPVDHSPEPEELSPLIADLSQPIHWAGIGLFGR